MSFPHRGQTDTGRGGEGLVDGKVLFLGQSPGICRPHLAGGLLACRTGPPYNTLHRTPVGKAGSGAAAVRSFCQWCSFLTSSCPWPLRQGLGFSWVGLSVGEPGRQPPERE